jgi:hypothetical protein
MNSDFDYNSRVISIISSTIHCFESELGRLLILVMKFENWIKI